MYPERARDIQEAMGLRVLSWDAGPEVEMEKLVAVLLEFLDRV